MPELTIYNILLISSFILSVIVFFTLFLVVAPYGRHAREGWGFYLNSKLGWLIMELPACIGFLLLFIIGKRTGDIISITFLILWQAHYIHRTFIYPLSINTSKKNMPFSIMIFGFLFNTMNAYLNGRYLYYFSGSYSTSWFVDIRFIIGLILFIFGYYINRSSDNLLKRLREDNGHDYKIPYGGLFTWISSPNYLGEIIIWVGWAVLTWSFSGLSFAVWTIANLVPRAYANHIWYKKYFIDYPTNRRALLPKLW